MFYLCRSDSGGGVGNLGTASIEQSEFVNNVGDRGAGIYSGPGSQVTVTGCTLVGNFGELGYGLCADTASVALANSTIYYNYGSHASVATYGGTLDITSCTITYNLTQDIAGHLPGVQLSGTTTRIRNSIVANNQLGFRESDLDGCCVTDQEFDLIGTNDVTLNP